MVAHQYFDNRFQPAAPAAPSTSPPPKRFRRGLLVAVAAIALASGAGSGAAAAFAIDHGTQPTAASTAATTTSTLTTSTSASSATAATVYKQDLPGVVTITSIVSSAQGTGQATGSGVVLDTTGDILTNAHVIAGGSHLQVTFSDGRTVNAVVVGSSSSADLAVIRVSVAASTLTPLALGNSSSVQVGDTVYAIGSPFGLSGTLTEGIVSNVNQSGAAQGNSLTGLMQTDAAINPGNSGGPLVNAQGQVIGINNSIISPVDGNVGVGFAIPSNQVKQILTSLEGGLNV
jgi:S1-C subfamily serine protease